MPHEERLDALWNLIQELQHTTKSYMERYEDPNSGQDFDEVLDAWIEAASHLREAHALLEEFPSE